MFVAIAPVIIVGPAVVAWVVADVWSFDPLEVAFIACADHGPLDFVVVSDKTSVVFFSVEFRLKSASLCRIVWITVFFFDNNDGCSVDGFT